MHLNITGTAVLSDRSSMVSLDDGRKLVLMVAMVALPAEIAEKLSPGQSYVMREVTGYECGDDIVTLNFDLNRPPIEPVEDLTGKRVEQLVTSRIWRV